MTETMPITFDPPGLVEAVQMGAIPAGSVLCIPGKRYDQLALSLREMKREWTEGYATKELRLYTGSGGHITVMRGMQADD